ncbi:MauE/DoxX family redox-associated membrane protein [Anditalea andensis]|uniref:MauE/DoxX family redox-associated membrane protein n=1 Tax=Anditalea andensis TaxID=1048983 RepID=UPI0013DE87F0|nr:MauE/DoxX family redox-associated membrane protein [Anditalea andensis]
MRQCPKITKNTLILFLKPFLPTNFPISNNKKNFETININKMNTLNLTHIYHICTLILVMMLGYTGMAKLVDFKGFRSAVLNQPFPSEWGERIAVGVPAAELLLVGLLLFDSTRLAGLVGSLVLMTAFTVYVGLIWIGAFERTPCGCAGILDALGWGEHLAVNLVFVGISVVGIYVYRK